MNKLEKFLEKLKKVHGDSIDASKVEYVNSITKVCLICHKKIKTEQNMVNIGKHQLIVSEVALVLNVQMKDVGQDKKIG